jgi:hypothetical protein
MMISVKTMMSAMKLSVMMTSVMMMMMSVRR